MSDPSTTDQGSDIRPLGCVLAAIFGGIVIVAVLYSWWHPTGLFSPPADNSASGNAIDLTKLREEAEVFPTPEPTPLKLHQELPEILAQMPSPTPTPTPRQKSALQMWREQEAMKAREADLMVAAFHHQTGNTLELNGGPRSALKPPASPYTVMEGAHILASLKQRVNSDYSGDLTAQVLQVVYDSATGRFPLIPNGSTLVGKFASPNGPLSERVAISWHRIIFPDTSSIDLQDSPTTDEQGVAGATGDVDAHHWQKLGAAALLTLMSIGPTLATAMNTGSSQYYNPNQEIALYASSTAGAQAANHANQWLQPYLSRPKTITLFPGQLVDVYVNHDLVLPSPFKDTAGITPLMAVGGK